jgi:hypothetical protein
MTIGSNFVKKPMSPKYHFQRLSLNLHDNGATNFSTDITGLVRGLDTMALLTMALGLLIGTTIGSDPVQGPMERSHC